MLSFYDRHKGVSFSSRDFPPQLPPISTASACTSCNFPRHQKMGKKGETPVVQWQGRCFMPPQGTCRASLPLAQFCCFPKPSSQFLQRMFQMTSKIGHNGKEVFKTNRQTDVPHCYDLEGTFTPGPS